MIDRIMFWGIVSTTFAYLAYGTYVLLDDFSWAKLLIVALFGAWFIWESYVAYREMGVTGDSADVERRSGR